jgi:hypothetical protein
MFTTPTLLRAFRHPLLIFSIFVLLLNDHVLKVVCPSELTGKLSDFAGLFFFPFVVGVVIQIGLVFPRLLESGANYGPSCNALPKTREDKITALILLAGFLLTGLTFAAIKTLPGVNGWAVALLTRLLGLPVQIVPDPSDLIALFSFAPAWLLWQRIEQGQPAARPGKLAYIFLTLSVLASLASSPSAPKPSIQRLVATWENSIYAGSTITSERYFPPMYVSFDQARTWQNEPEIPPDVADVLRQPLVLPVAGCDPLNLQVCYRIDGRAQVDESWDGGETWSVAWQLPAGRDSYLRRVTGQNCITNCGNDPALRTYDMAFATGRGESILVVALGTEGLLTHSPSRGWQRNGLTLSQNGYQFLAIDPAPLTATTFNEIFLNTMPEWLLALGLGCLAYLGFSLWIWIFAAQHPAPGTTHSAGWIFSPLWVLGAVLFVIMVPWAAPSRSLFFMGIQSSDFFYALMTFLVVFFVVNDVLWRRVREFSGRPDDFRRLGWSALKTAAGITAIPTICFVLWALGVIAHYETAYLLSLLLGLAWLVRCVVQIRDTLK